MLVPLGFAQNIDDTDILKKQSLPLLLSQIYGQQEVLCVYLTNYPSVCPPRPPSCGLGDHAPGLSGTEAAERGGPSLAVAHSLF